MLDTHFAPFFSNFQISLRYIQASSFLLKKDVLRIYCRKDVIVMCWTKV